MHATLTARNFFRANFYPSCPFTLLLLTGLKAPTDKILLFTAVFFQLDFSHGKFGLPSPGKANCDKVALPKLACMLGVLVFP